MIKILSHSPAPNDQFYFKLQPMMTVCFVLSSKYDFWDRMTGN